MPPTPNLPSSHQSRDQVILPLRIAFGICLRSIFTRLSRSLVTLFGVSLGIAFLMSTATGFHIKLALREDAAMAREVERRVVMLRSEIGRLYEKRFVVALDQPSRADLAFIQELIRSQGARVNLIRGGASSPSIPTPALLASIPSAVPTAMAETDALLLVGGRRPSLSPEFTSTLDHKPIYAFQKGPTGQGLQINTLDLDLRPDEIATANELETQARYRVYWLVGISLLITIIGIANAMLMSVTERIREIGTMKCLGALPSFIVKLFLIESFLMGLAGAILGSLGGALFSLLAFSCTFGLVPVWSSVSYPTLALYALLCSLVGVFLAVLAGIYPARVAAKMIPSSALATNV